MDTRSRRPPSARRCRWSPAGLADYACIPLDVPAPEVDVEALRRFVQSFSDGCAFTRNEIRYVTYYARKPARAGRLLRPADPGFADLQPGTSFAWDPAFATRFPALVRWLERLPFRELHGIDLVTQTADVPDHMDIFGNNNSVSYYRRYRAVEPRLYRALLFEPDDARVRRRSFYVTKRFGGRRHFVVLPRETHIFAMSSSICYHGSVRNRGHYKTTAAIFGALDPVRHLELLRRSLARFPRHAIRLAPGPVSGPGAFRPYRGT
jgi:hypothetical protein